MKYLKKFEASQKASEYKYRNSSIIQMVDDLLLPLKDDGLLYVIEFEDVRCTKLNLKITTNEKWKNKSDLIDFKIVKPQLDQVKSFLESENFFIEKTDSLKDGFSTPSERIGVYCTYNDKYGTFEYNNIPSVFHKLIIIFHLKD